MTFRSIAAFLQEEEGRVPHSSLLKGVVLIASAAVGLSLIAPKSKGDLGIILQILCTMITETMKKIAIHVDLKQALLAGEGVKFSHIGLITEFN